jgi:hypothetical protein
MKFTPPHAWYDRLVVTHAQWQNCHGVPVAMAALDDDPVLLAQVAAALQLIAAHAPAAFAQLQSLSRGILVAPLHGARGEWRPSIQACLISREYLQQDHASEPAIASTIIHELAHARLDALGIASTAERAGRVERICFRASQRFLQVLPAGSKREAALEELEEYLRFDPAIWESAASQDYRPWHVRVVAFCLRRAGHLWHRETPT